MRNLCLSVLAYCLIAFVFFGDLIKPVGLLTFWSGRLATPWPVFVIGSGAIAALVFLIPPRMTWIASVKPPLFVTVWMALSIVLTGLHADHARQQRLAAFGADAVFQHSFFRSLREAPRDFQDYLHAGALKDCTPYAWSYRSMATYRLPPAAAINVLPRAWIQRCAIAS